MEAEKRVTDVAGLLTQEPLIAMDYQTAGGDTRRTELIPYDQNYYAAKTDGTAVLLVNRTSVNTLLGTLEPFLAG